MAYYSDELIDEVIAQNDIVEVVSEYVQLTKSGRNYMGLCPFHREKSPSFCVSMDKQIYKCFGCSAGGNVIYFVMKIENFDFLEALEFLATRAHLDLSKYIVSGGNKKQEKNLDLKAVILQINKETALYYHHNLMEKLQENSNPVKEYIEKRKLDNNTIIKFGLGYGSGKLPLHQYLKEKGFTKEQMLAANVIVENEKKLLYDRFYSRLIFPIFDVKGQVIAFGGRVLDNSLPKYLNSAENVVYYKGKNLYGLNFVKKEKLNNIVIVEGYMDAVSLQKNGFTNVVASLGTALTMDQARLIGKFTDKVIIAYDQDGAGQEATLRGLDILVSKGLSVKVLKLDKEEIKDPDEYVNKMGPERLRTCLKNSMSLVEFKVSQFEKELDNNNIDSKIKFLNSVANILAKIENNIERDIYVDRIAERYKIGKDPIVKEIEKQLHKTATPTMMTVSDTVNKIKSNISAKKRVEQYIIALMVCKDKKISQEIIKTVTEATFKDEKTKNLYNALTALSTEFDLQNIDILSKLDQEELIKEFTDVLYVDINEMGKDKLLKDVLVFMQKNELADRREEILRRLKQDITKDEKEILQIELSQIVIELNKLKLKF